MATLARRSARTAQHRGMPVLLRRVIQLPFVLIGVSIVLFFATRILPGNTVRMVAGDSAPPAVLNEIKASLGLNRPVYIQYLKYLDGVIHGNLGQSIEFKLPVSSLIASAFPATLELIVAGMIIATVLAFMFGLIGGIWANKWPDVIVRIVSMVLTAAPPFFVAIIGILYLGFDLHWFPISGRGNPPDLHHILLPAIVLGAQRAGTTGRLLRATLIDVLHRDHIRAARARGIDARIVILKYALRNALPPAMTDIGVGMADVVGAAILIETIFAWPGVGRLVYLGIYWKDFPLLSGAILVLLVYAVVMNFAVDILYGIADPRLRVGAQQ